MFENHSKSLILRHCELIEHYLLLSVFFPTIAWKIIIQKSFKFFNLICTYFTFKNLKEFYFDFDEAEK